MTKTISKSINTEKPKNLHNFVVAEIEAQKAETLQFIKEHKLLYYLDKLKVLQYRHNTYSNINDIRCNPLHPLSYIMFIYDYINSLFLFNISYFKNENLFKYQ